MHNRLILWAVFNVVAVALPVSVLWLTFGTKTAVDPTSEAHLMAIGGAAFAAFALSFGGSFFARKSDFDGGPHSLAEIAARLASR